MSGASLSIETAELTRFAETVLELWLREWTEPCATYSVSGRDLLRAFCLFSVADLHRHFTTKDFAALASHVLSRTADLRQCATPSPDGRFLLQFKAHAVQRILQFRDGKKSEAKQAVQEEAPLSSETPTPATETSQSEGNSVASPRLHDSSWVTAFINKMQGDEEESSLVLDEITRDNYKLVHSVQALVQPNLGESELVEVVTCLGLMGAKDAEAYAVMSLMGLVSRLVSCIEKAKDEEPLLALMGLLCCICHQSKAFQPKDKDSIENQLLPYLFSALRLGNTSEGLGKSIVITMLTINKMYEFIDVAQSPFINLLITLPPEEVEIFLEIFIAVFNRSGESYERHRDLKFLKEAFSHESCVRLFYTNDLRVIMDILVREIRDLSDEASPESVPNRYWEVLYTLLHVHPKAWDNPEVRSLVTEKRAEIDCDSNRTAKLWASRIAQELEA